MKSEIVVVLDESGSMTGTRDDAIGGFNSFIEAQKKVEGEATLSLTKFTTQFEAVHLGVPLQDVPPLDHKTYVPHGMTALLDAVGKTIDEVGLKLDKTEAKPDKVYFIIITDGAENSSREYTYAQVKDKIEHQRSKYNWEFLFLGVGEDAFNQAADVGIGRSQTMTYGNTKDGQKQAYGQVTNTVSRSRVTGQSLFAPDKADEAVDTSWKK